MRLEFQDSIDRYLLNKMSDEERTLFEAKCDNIPELEEQLEHTRDVRRVITERNKILTRIQELEEECEREKRTAAHKKIIALSWISGIAAVFVVGLFLFTPSNVVSPESSGRQILMNTNDENSIANSAAIRNEKEQEKLLAKKDVDKKEKRHSNARIDEEQVFSFGKNDIVKANPQAVPNEVELERVMERKKELTVKLADLEYLRSSGEIDSVVYESSVGLLKYQRDRLCWQQSIILLNMSRKNEALAILDELRREEGLYQHKADSLYNELK